VKTGKTVAKIEMAAHCSALAYLCHCDTALVFLTIPKSLMAL